MNNLSLSITFAGPFTISGHLPMYVRTKEEKCKNSSLRLHMPVQVASGHAPYKPRKPRTRKNIPGPLSKPEAIQDPAEDD